MKSSAIISDCKKYRYSLTREWDKTIEFGQGTVMFIGLNPSTADANLDDPTIRRCIGFAKSWGYNKLVMANLFAFRATNPKDMKAAKDPIGTDNARYLIELSEEADLIVAAWGTGGAFQDRGNIIREHILDMYYLKLTRAGHPSHPLYLNSRLEPKKWNQNEA